MSVNAILKIHVIVFADAEVDQSSDVDKFLDVSIDFRPDLC
jgi:hypothetical protein